MAREQKTVQEHNRGIALATDPTSLFVEEATEARSIVRHAVLLILSRTRSDIARICRGMRRTALRDSRASKKRAMRKKLRKERRVRASIIQ